jgi:hypothetical protein
MAKSQKPSDLKNSKAIYIDLADLQNQAAEFLGQPSSDGWKTFSSRYDWRELRLNLLKCPKRDNKVLLEDVLNVSGLTDALWVAGAASGHEKALRLFAVNCVQRIVPVLERSEPTIAERIREALSVARRHAIGEATSDELNAEKLFFLRLLNPHKGVRTDEDGDTLYSKFKFNSLTVLRRNLKQDLAYTAVMLATREDIGGGVWRAAKETRYFLDFTAHDAVFKSRKRFFAAARIDSSAIAESASEAVNLLAKDFIEALTGKSGRFKDDKALLATLDGLTSKLNPHRLNQDDLASSADLAIRKSLEMAPGSGFESLRALFSEIVGDEVTDAFWADLKLEFQNLCALRGEYKSG